MDALRHTLFAPAGASLVLVMGCVSAIKLNAKARYAATDENGKRLLPHPYQPWTAVDPKYTELTDKAWRAFRTSENVQEWAFLSLPMVWIVGIFGGAVPHVTDNMVNAFMGVTSIVYAYANHKYMQGYVKEAEKRVDGFKLRTNVCKLWLAASGISLLSFCVQELIMGR